MSSIELITKISISRRTGISKYIQYYSYNYACSVLYLMYGPKQNRKKILKPLRVIALWFVSNKKSVVDTIVSHSETLKIQMNNGKLKF